MPLESLPILAPFTIPGLGWTFNDGRSEAEPARARRGSELWGWRGLVRNDHAGLTDGLQIRIERILEPAADQRLMNNQLRLVTDAA